MTKDFHHRFNIPIQAEEARRRFINRAVNDVFNRYFGIESLFIRGMDFADKVGLETAVASAIGERYKMGAALTFSGASFINCLQGLEGLHSHLGRWPDERKFVHEAIVRLLKEAECDLGVSWDGKSFRPSGALELDLALVNEPLAWIDAPQYESVRLPMVKALQHYLESLQDPAKLSDAITDAYESLEALAKIVTDRPNKDLSANAELFVTRLGVSDGYKRILKEYIGYAQAYRHAAPTGISRPTPGRVEVESFVYLTGLFVRLALQASNREKTGAA